MWLKLKYAQTLRQYLQENDKALCQTLAKDGAHSEPETIAAHYGAIKAFKLVQDKPRRKRRAQVITLSCWARGNMKDMVDCATWGQIALSISTHADAFIEENQLCLHTFWLCFCLRFPPDEDASPIILNFSLGML